MVIAGSPAEIAALDEFRAELERIMAGVPAGIPEPLDDDQPAAATETVSRYCIGSLRQRRAGDGVPSPPCGFLPAHHPAAAAQRTATGTATGIRPPLSEQRRVDRHTAANRLAGGERHKHGDTPACGVRGVGRSGPGRVRRTQRTARTERRQNLRNHGRAGIGPAHRLAGPGRAGANIPAPRTPPTWCRRKWDCWRRKIWLRCC